MNRLYTWDINYTFTTKIMHMWKILYTLLAMTVHCIRHTISIHVTKTTTRFEITQTVFSRAITCHYVWLVFTSQGSHNATLKDGQTKPPCCCVFCHTLCLASHKQQRKLNLHHCRLLCELPRPTVLCVYSARGNYAAFDQFNIRGVVCMRWRRLRLQEHACFERGKSGNSFQ